MIRKFIAVGCTVLGMAGSTAFAANTATMDVQTDVPGACTISSNTALADFGTYAYDGPASTNSHGATGTLLLNCSATTDYFVSVNSGTHASGAQTRLQNTTNAAEFLSYDIFSDVAYASAFPTTAGTLGTGATGGTGDGTNHTLQVYYKLPRNQTTPAPGTYTDTVTFTITY